MSKLYEEIPATDRLVSAEILDGIEQSKIDLSKILATGQLPEEGGVFTIYQR